MARQSAEFRALVADAMTHFQAGRPAEAERAYRAALAVVPHDAAVTHNLGVAIAAQGRQREALGRFEEARQYYASALKIVPDEPSVLCNLGLSYVLSKDLAKADEALRRAYSLASSDPRIRANRALVLGLQGRMNEAEIIAKADLPPDQGAANVAALKQMLARKQASGGEKMPVASTK